ncbi:g502 [Coccomyxa elongata]
MLGRKRRDAAEAEARVASISVTLDALRSSVESFRANTDAKLALQEERLDSLAALSRDAKSECDRTAQALDGLREHLCTLHSEVAGIREKSDSTGRSMDHFLDDAYISMESHGERLRHISDGLASKTAQLERTQGNCSSLSDRLTELEARQEELASAWNAEIDALRAGGCRVDVGDEGSVPDEPLLDNAQEGRRSCPMCALLMWPVLVIRTCIHGVMKSCGLA